MKWCSRCRMRRSNTSRVLESRMRSTKIVLVPSLSTLPLCRCPLQRSTTCAQAAAAGAAKAKGLDTSVVARQLMRSQRRPRRQQPQRLCSGDFLPGQRNPRTTRAALRVGAYESCCSHDPTRCPAAENTICSICAIARQRMYTDAFSSFYHTRINYQRR